MASILEAIIFIAEIKCAMLTANTQLVLCLHPPNQTKKYAKRKYTCTNGEHFSDY